MLESQIQVEVDAVDEVDYFIVTPHQRPERSQTIEAGRFISVIVNGNGPIRIPGQNLFSAPLEQVLNNYKTELSMKQNLSTYNITYSGKSLDLKRTLAQQNVDPQESIKIFSKYTIETKNTNQKKLIIQSYSKGRQQVLASHDITLKEAFKDKVQVFILERSRFGPGGEIVSGLTKPQNLPRNRNRRVYAVEARANLSVIPSLQQVKLHQEAVDKILSQITDKQDHNTEALRSKKQSLKTSQIYQSCSPDTLDILSLLKRHHFKEINNSIMFKSGMKFQNTIGDRLQLLENALKILPKQRERKVLSTIGSRNESLSKFKYFCSTKIQILYNLTTQDYEQIGNKYEGKSRPVIYKINTLNAKRIDQLNLHLSAGDFSQKNIECYMLMNDSFFEVVGLHFAKNTYDWVELNEVSSPRGTNILLWLGEPIDDNLRVEIEASKLFPSEENNCNYSVVCASNQEQLAEILEQFWWITNPKYINLKVVIKCSQGQTKLAQNFFQVLHEKYYPQEQINTQQKEPIKNKVLVWCDSQYDQRSLLENSPPQIQKKLDLIVSCQETQFRNMLKCQKIDENNQTPCCLLF